MHSNNCRGCVGLSWGWAVMPRHSLELMDAIVATLYRAALFEKRFFAFSRHLYGTGWTTGSRSRFWGPLPAWQIKRDEDWTSIGGDLEKTNLII